MIYALWSGGYGSYTTPDADTERELFPSIRAAGEALQSRLENGDRWNQTFTYADRVEKATTPAVGRDCHLDLYATPDSTELFTRLTIGPRGGVKRENA